MRGILRVLLPAAAAALVLTPINGMASDHSDGVKTGLDLAGDITDLFTFTSPKDPNKLVMIMNANGFASASSTFSNAIDYKIRIRPVADVKTMVPSASATSEKSIVCSFAGAVLIGSNQRATCVVDLGGTKETLSFDTRMPGFKAGGSAEQNGIRIFAGIRSDPWFADVAKIADFDKGKRIDKPNGSNHLLQGKNVLSIVVELDKSKVVGSNGPLLAVTAQTVRRSGL
jgi:hypothetical protein